MLEHVDNKYHQFYNNSYSKHYEIYFCNKNKMDILKKYIFCFDTSYLETNRIDTYRACKFTTKSKSLRRETDKLLIVFIHVEFSRNTLLRYFHKFIRRKNMTYIYSK